MNGKCILCGGAFHPHPLIELTDMPASAQDIPAREETAGERGIALALYQCAACGLVQFDCPPVRYYREVIRAGGGSSTMTALRRAQYGDFIRKFGLEGRRIVEVGCGQGEFLSILGEFDVQACGVEWSEEMLQKARAKGLNVARAFAADAASVLPGAPYDAFVQFNFLEHQPDPNGMLQAIYRSLTPQGVGLVTVPSLEYMLENDGYYELIRDHLAYYSAETLQLLFRKNGFEILSLKTVNRDTHEIMVRKRTPLHVARWEENFRLLRTSLHAYCDRHIGAGRKVAVWGASHQGFTVVSTLGLAGKLTYIIDSAPFKQGRYAPASHLRIVAPAHFHAEPVDSILILAPGYADEIADIIRRDFGSGVEIAVLRSDKLEILT